MSTKPKRREQEQQETPNAVAPVTVEAVDAQEAPAAAHQTAEEEKTTTPTITCANGACGAQVVSSKAHFPPVEVMELVLGKRLVLGREMIENLPDLLRFAMCLDCAELSRPTIEKPLYTIQQVRSFLRSREDREKEKERREKEEEARREKREEQGKNARTFLDKLYAVAAREATAKKKREGERGRDSRYEGARVRISRREEEENE